VEDLVWNAVEDFASEMFEDCNKEALAMEIKSILSTQREGIPGQLQGCEELRKAVDWMKRVAPERINSNLLNKTEKKLIYNPDMVPQSVRNEYDYSALETIVNVALHRRIITESNMGQFFVPQKITEWRSW